jgi:hypothetical protein
MKEFCSCPDSLQLRESNRKIIIWDPAYGWVLNWIELTEERGYTQVHRYGVSISHCPMCGQRLKNIE